MLTLHHVTKTYGKGHLQVDALRDVELQVDTGEFVAVIGPSGSGKTTLMNILGCLDDPTQGEYLLGGVPVGRLSGREKAVLRNREIGFVFQSFNLVSSLTAQENVELPLVFRGMEGEKRRELSRLALEQVGLSRRAHHRPWELSGGQQQRVAIARAIAAHPPLILADEPTGNLDPPSGQQVMELLRRMNQNGHTIVLITHDAQVAAMAGRRLRMEEGQLQEQN
ncbi:ABC transporter ATP-binding protein [Ruminococcaceae bacterium AM07-15]|nr:ABC transporter ATP-binding protein [Ruminococcaceae bacterium AM07-15]